jgi:hypothetical protein
MLDIKDQMIEEAQERRENNENVLDDIDSSGEKFDWSVSSGIAKLHDLTMHSPSEDCDKPECTKQCFVSGHFQWCLEHSAPSSEEVHGTYRVTEVMITKVNGQVVEKSSVVEKSKCAVAWENDDQEHPDCNVVVSGQSSIICAFYEISNQRQILWTSMNFASLKQNDGWLSKWRSLRHSASTVYIMIAIAPVPRMI